MLKGMEICRAIGRQPALKPFVVEEIAPGPAVADDKGLRDYLRTTGVSNLHPVGTCRMGESPRKSVLNSYCQSHEVANLFVVDGSCMVSLPEKNLTLTLMALAVRSARYIVEQKRTGDL